MIIESVEITGFWGRKTAYTKINNDVTIFIGENGTGKTTFVNCIAAVLNVDIFQLSTLQFKEIIIKLKDRNNKTQRKISITNHSEEEIPFNRYDYKISKIKKFTCQILKLSIEIRNKVK